LYRVGAFKASDVPIVAGALRWWAAGLIFYATTMYLLRTFYSLKDTRTPMVVNLFLTFGVQIVLYWVLTTGVGSWHGIGIDGIPIADSVFYLCLSAVLVVLIRRRIGEFGTRGVALTYTRMAIASVIGALVAWGVSALIAPVVLGVSGALLQIAVGGIVGLVAAFGLGRLLGVTEVSSATQLLSRALRRRGGTS
jgi:putative peptidoglycan lipid II flippase